MPVLDGFELTRRIREAEAAPNGAPRGARRRIPIVAVTANVLAGEAERCRAAGMDDYIGKPVQLARLQEVLQRWMPAAGSEAAAAPADTAAAVDPRPWPACSATTPGPSPRCWRSSSLRPGRRPW